MCSKFTKPDKIKIKKNKTIKEGGISPWTSGTWLQMSTWNELNEGIEENKKKHN